MTTQEIFDKVSKHLLTQNQKSMHPTKATACAYRGAGGLKCAIGCLIPDELFDDSWNHYLVGDLPDEILVLLGYTKNVGLLEDLQSVHDASSVAEWALGLRKVATEHNLEGPA